MKKKINLNYFYSLVFVKQLKRLGVNRVCISPGSRNTPLTMAFASERGIKKYVIPDERSAAFFALGMAKATKLPVAILTTSGTATAELYPAIVEAYNSRVPLIILTADRPPELHNCGANQTINQDNIYKNHIRYSNDAGLPKINKQALKRIQIKAQKLFSISLLEDAGPVHLNFPFRKPLEPKTHNAEIERNMYDLFLNETVAVYSPRRKINSHPGSAAAYFVKSKRTLIFVNTDNYNRQFFDLLEEFSVKFRIPVICDSTVPLRYKKAANVITSAGNFLRTETADKIFEPDLIIQFGGAPTVNSLLEYYAAVDCVKILVNEFGDLKDPSRSYTKIFKNEPESFLTGLSEAGSDKETEEGWLELWLKTELKTTTKMESEIRNAPFPSEPGIVRNAIAALPKKANLFVSNSMAVRDLDFFGGRTENELNVYVNRGASGIDGINSTALGIAASSKRRTFLITGDLAFFHDSNGLWTAKRYGLNLTVILINNSGGGIFKLLPIAKENKYFDEYFKTDLNLEFRKLTEFYNGKFYAANSWENLRDLIKSSAKEKGLRIIEIATDADSSVERRISFWNKMKEEFGS